MNACEVEYLTELSPLWNRALDEAATLEALKSTAHKWRELCGDVVDAVSGWNEETFAAWVKAKGKERRGRYMGDDDAARFAVVLMPHVLLLVGLVAGEYRVPEGTAFKRLRDVGRLKLKDGRIVVVAPNQPKEV